MSALESLFGVPTRTSSRAGRASRTGAYLKKFLAERRA